MPFSDTRVQTYINEAMRTCGNNPNEAWSSLYMQRQNTDPNDTNVELAAAEHYMYARWMVSSGETNEYVMRTLTLGYDAVKIAGYFPPIWLIRWFAGHTWTPPSTDSIRWGMRGCSDGSNDRARSGR